MSGPWTGTSNELASEICRVLGLKRCVRLTLDFDFDQLPTVSAELLLDKDDAGEIRRIVEQYDLHPEKIVEEEKEKQE